MAPAPTECYEKKQAQESIPKHVFFIEICISGFEPGVFGPATVQAGTYFFWLRIRRKRPKPSAPAPKT